MRDITFRRPLLETGENTQTSSPDTKFTYTKKVKVEHLQRSKEASTSRRRRRRRKKVNI